MVVSSTVRSYAGSPIRSTYTSELIRGPYDGEQYLQFVYHRICEISPRTTLWKPLQKSSADPGAMGGRRWKSPPQEEGKKGKIGKEEGKCEKKRKNQPCPPIF